MTPSFFITRLLSSSIRVNGSVAIEALSLVPLIAKLAKLGVDNDGFSLDNIFARITSFVTSSDTIGP